MRIGVLLTLKYTKKILGPRHCLGRKARPIPDALPVTIARRPLRSMPGMDSSGLIMAGGAGQGFLHWGGVRPARVLFKIAQDCLRAPVGSERVHDDNRRAGAEAAGQDVRGAD